MIRINTTRLITKPKAIFSNNGVFDPNVYAFIIPAKTNRLRIYVHKPNWLIVIREPLPDFEKVPARSECADECQYLIPSCG
jgi:hypothetical protein